MHRPKSLEFHGPINLMILHAHWYNDPKVFPNPSQFVPERLMKDQGDEMEVTSFVRSIF